MISTDRNMFAEGSSVAKRMISYGESFGELHVVVFALESHNLSSVQISPKVFLYPTSSTGRFKYILDGINIGRKIGRMLYFGQTVITSQDPFETGIVGIFLKRVLKVPLQVQLHTDLFAKGFYDGALLNWIRFQFAPFILKRADGVRVVREKIKTDLIKICRINPESITVLPIFVDVGALQNAPSKINLKEKYPEFTHRVLMSSRLTGEKNVALGIRAFAKALPQVPKAGLVIVGSGPLQKRLETLVRELKIEAQVKFEGWQEDLVSYYRGADVFLSTSEFEGYGMSLIEAAALECAIISSEVGVAGELLKDKESVLLCKSQSVECFASHLATLLLDPEARNTLADGAKSAVSTLIQSHAVYVALYHTSLELLLFKKQSV